MRNFQNAMQPQPGWQVDWAIVDRYRFLDDAQNIHFRLTDFTTGADAHLCEGWIVAGSFDNTTEAWIPRVLTRRSGETAPLESTFVALLEPYHKQPAIARVERLLLTNETGTSVKYSHIALAITLATGDRDLLVLRDPMDETTGVLCQREWQITTDAAMLLASTTETGTMITIAVRGGHKTHIGPSRLVLTDDMDYVEVKMDDTGPTLVHGAYNMIAEMVIQTE